MKPKKCGMVALFFFVFLKKLSNGQQITFRVNIGEVPNLPDVGAGK
jgi:hypothetical protein